MSGYLLDTNICVHYLKGEHALEAKVTAVGLRNCFISELTIAEMLYGLAKCEPAYAAQQRQYITKLQRLFNTRLLPIATAFELYGPEKVRIMEQMKQGKMGKYPGEFDVLIACTALANQLTLVTRNTKDFAEIANLELENWIDAALDSSNSQ
jgi:tRNA(fMet)-specific endonuclease VapC